MPSLSQMNFVDIIILIIFFMSVIVGLVRGLVSEIISLLTLIVAFIVAIMFSNSLAAYFTSTPSVQNMVVESSNAIGTNTAAPVSYVAIAVSFGLLFSAVAIIGSIVKYIINIPFAYGILGFGNRILGGAFGLARGFIINLVLIFLVQLSPLGTEPWWVSSSYVQAYQPTVGWLGTLVSPALSNLREKFNTTLQGVNASLQGISNKL